MSERERDRPPLPVRLLARGSSLAIARAPRLWPLLRGPTQRFWNNAAGAWDARINPDGAEHLAALAAACERLDPVPRTILELGTGTGAGAIMLAGRFLDAEVTGVDLSEAMIDLARKKAPAELGDRLRFTVADAADLPFEDGSFDVVCQLNLPLFAESIARVCASQGHAIIASSRGPQTPYYTPGALLRSSLEKHGFHEIDRGERGDGTYFIARRR